MIKLKQLSPDGAVVGDSVVFNGTEWAPGLGSTSTGPTGNYSNAIGAVSLHDVVYVSAPSTVERADNDDVSKQPVIGMVIQIIDPTNCVVQYTGEVTGFAGLSSNDTYYLDSVPGQITVTPPTSMGDIVQKVGFAKSAVVFVLMIDRDFTVLA